VYSAYQSTVGGNKMIPKREGRIIRTYDGIEYTGYYTFENGWLTVHCGDQTEKAHLDGPTNPEAYAGIMLINMVKHPKR
jgi:hypothetical protein